MFFLNRLSQNLVNKISETILLFFPINLKQKIKIRLISWSVLIFTFLILFVIPFIFILITYLSINFDEINSLSNREVFINQSTKFIIYCLLALFLHFYIDICKNKESRSYFYHITNNKDKYTRTYISFCFYIVFYIFLIFNIHNILISFYEKTTFYIFLSLIFMYILCYPSLLKATMLSNVNKKDFLFNRKILIDRIIYLAIFFWNVFCIQFIENDMVHFWKIEIFIFYFVNFSLAITRFILIWHMTINSNLFAFNLSKERTYKTDEKKGVFIKKLTYSYIKGKNILENINADFECSKISIILGLNGAGKTTFLKCISNIICPDNGIITTGDTVFIPADESFNANYPLCCFFNLIMKMNKEITLEQIDEYLLEYDLKKYSNCNFNELSLGTKNKTLMIGALLLQMDVFLIDEPIVTLDPIATQLTIKFLKQLRQKNVTIIIATHLLDIAYELGDKICFLKDNHIISVNNHFDSLEIFKNYVSDYLK